MLKDVAPGIRIVESVNGVVAPAASSGMTGSSQASASPEDVVRNFYRWYLHTLYESPEADPFREHKSDVEKYVTARRFKN